MKVFKENKVKAIEEKEFKQNINDSLFKKTNFIFVTGKEIIFKNITFQYCNFVNCYLRNCKFIDCKFIGVQFNNSNFRGSVFDGSTFDYCLFTKTIITTSILNKNLPGYENVAIEFARNLRVNYSEIGLTSGINKAIRVELYCTKVHYKKAVWSRETYYRKKYKGLKRINSFFKYYSFIFFDYLWGNGESFLKVLRSNVIFIILLSIILFIYNKSFSMSLSDSFQLFFGNYTGNLYPLKLIPIVGFAKYVLLGLYLTVIIKNLSRR